MAADLKTTSNDQAPLDGSIPVSFGMDLATGPDTFSLVKMEGGRPVDMATLGADATADLVVAMLDHINDLTDKLGAAAPDDRKIFEKVLAWAHQREQVQAQPALEALKFAKRAMGYGLPGSIYAKAHEKVDAAITTLESSAPSAPNFRDLLSRAHAIRTGWTYEFVAEVEAALAAPPAPAPSAASEREALTDDWIEAVFKRSGGKWDGNRWVIEDADLYPFVRAALHSTGKPDGEVAPSDWPADVAAWVEQQDYRRTGPVTEEELSQIQNRRFGNFFTDRCTLTEWAFACNAATLARLLVRAAPADAPVAEPVGHVTSFGDLGCTVDYVSPQKYRPPVGAPLYARLPAPEDAKDAARYRWLRAQHWEDCGLFVVNGLGRKLSTPIPLGTSCPSEGLLDDEIDAAMAKESDA